MPESADPELDQHLSRMTTQWAVLFKAHSDSTAAARAQEELLRRYGGAVYRYLVSVVRDVHIADELAQEFALNFLRGGFRGARPERGRFRDYIKASLFNLIRAYHKKQQRQQPAARLDEVEPAVRNDEETFIRGWRDELMARTWDALEAHERDTGRLYYTLLKHRARNPQASSAVMADDLGAKLGKPLTAAGVRQTLHRAREKFAELLVAEVARSLQTASPDLVEQELIDLGLHTYCGDALRRWPGGMERGVQ